MSALPKEPREGSLALYKNRPARVARVGDKVEIELAGGETQKVRLKDVTLLHPGPLRNLAELQPLEGETIAAWELLAGGTTTLPELAELAYGAYTPVSAWAAWQLVADGLYFRGSPDAIQASTPDEAAQNLARRQADTEEKRAWGSFLSRLSIGRFAPEDVRYLREVEELALKIGTRSRALAALNREETPENAHGLLLEVGYWSPARNPYPRRLGLDLQILDLPLPELPDEPRRDLTHLPAYAIDDPGSDTPDDALSLDDGSIWVHVADPAALIAPDSPLDLEARGRAATLYLPESITPMLPPAATPRLGLGLSAISPALSFRLAIDAEGRLGDFEATPSWVRVTRLTYDEAEAQLEQEPFATLYRLGQVYAARRQADGAVAIDFPEVRISVDSEGKVDIAPSPEQRSRDLVQQAMIAAGEAVARFALERGIALPFSTNEGPAEPVGRPTTLSAMFAARRQLKRSQYRSAPARHAGLGLPAYTQVTSPLRRYLDLVAHQQLRAYLRGETLLDEAQILERVGAVEAIIGSLRQAELLSEKHWTQVYLQQHAGWRGEGVLVERRGGGGGAIMIPSLGLETTVHLNGEPALDASVKLLLQQVELPRLDVYFRALAQ